MAARVRLEDLSRFVSAAARAAGADEASSAAVTKVLVGASLRGVDSHGVRLLPHYVRGLKGGRLNGRPNPTFERRAASAGVLDADDGLGHLAGYRAIGHGIALAEETGLGAVTVIRSSHFGAAGAYALEAAERGYIGLSVCNADDLVLPFGGIGSFHGTNPIAFAAPLAGQRPYLIDMATSAVPWNRVLLYGALGRALPAQVAVDEAAGPTRDAGAAVALLPLGGPDYGYKGAALAGLVEVLSAALTGMAFSHGVPDFAGPDFATPRRLGQFFLVLKPAAFLPEAHFQAAMADYLAALRAQPAKPDTEVMAPGDREWAVEQRRSEHGIPLDGPTRDALNDVAEELGVAPLTAGGR
jgi:LDH2 family malate/lactate/ureidoglycolate dehydrogenase